MNKVITHSILSCFLLVMSMQLLGQSFTVTANKDSILVGEPLQITLQLTGAKKDNYIWPFLRRGDSIPAHFEVLDALPKQRLNNEEATISQQITITSFEPGEHVLVPFILQDTNGVLTSNTLTIKVNVLAIDTTLAFKDITPIKYPELNLSDRMKLAWKWIKNNWILLFCILFVLAIVFYLLFRKKAPKQEKPRSEPVQPSIAPELVAFKELDDLKQLDLISKNEHKQYYVRLCEILDRYLEARYSISTEDKTSKEIIGLVKNKLNTNDLSQLENILTTADLVKFAKQIPNDSICKEHMSHAEELIHNTKTE